MSFLHHRPEAHPGIGYVWLDALGRNQGPVPSSSIRNIFIRKARWFRVKTPDTVPDDLSLVPRTCVSERREPTPKDCPQTSTCDPADTDGQTHTHTGTGTCTHTNTHPKVWKVSGQNQLPISGYFSDTLAWLSLGAFVFKARA